jgi:hypothetical protein
MPGQHQPPSPNEQPFDPSSNQARSVPLLCPPILMAERVAVAHQDAHLVPALIQLVFTCSGVTSDCHVPDRAGWRATLDQRLVSQRGER